MCWPLRHALLDKVSANDRYLAYMKPTKSGHSKKTIVQEMAYFFLPVKGLFSMLI